jgi:ABC-type branched-subunit amino acid transport system ATPase component
VADRVYVLQRGRIVMEGTASDVTGDIGQVERAYLSGVVDDDHDGMA